MHGVVPPQVQDPAFADCEELSSILFLISADAQVSEAGRSFLIKGGNFSFFW